MCGECFEEWGIMGWYCLDPGSLYKTFFNIQAPPMYTDLSGFVWRNANL